MTNGIKRMERKQEKTGPYRQFISTDFRTGNEKGIILTDQS